MRLPQTARSSELGLQMTAMIDVVFLLLVFFLWTSSFDKPEFDLRSSLALPPSGNSASLSKKAPLPFDEIVVRIIGSNGANELRVNEMPVADFAQLRTRLSAIVSLGVQPAVIVHPDPSVPMELAIKAYDVARATGFDRVLFTVAK